jgi:hypothetical protein
MERIRSRCASRWVLAFVLVLAVGVVALPAAAIANGSISGTISHTGPFAAIEGVRVYLYPKGSSTAAFDMLTGADGGFSFPDVPNGTYLLCLIDENGVHSSSWYIEQLESYDPYTPFEYVVNDNPDYRVIAMKDGVGIHVHVERPGTQRIAGISVQAFRTMPAGFLDWSPNPELTDASGECTFTNLPAGNWRVMAYDVHAGTAPKWYTDGWYTPTGTFTLNPGESVAPTITVKMLPSMTVDIVGGAGWRQSLSGDIAFDLGMQSDYTSTGYYRVVPVGGPAPWWTTWDGSSQGTITLTEGAYEIQAMGATEPSLTDYGDDGDGPMLTVPLGIDNTKPHTTANVGTVSQAFLELKATDPLSGIGYTRYSLDGGAEQTYTDGSPVPLTRGVHSVTWYSRDKAGNTEDVHSGTIISGPQASVSTPKGSSRTRVRRTLTFSGKLTRATNHRRLTLLAYRFDGANWVLTRTKAVTTHTPRRRGMTTYRGSIKFTAKGLWKVVARYEGDGYWVQSWSAARYVTVK